MEISPLQSLNIRDHIRQSGMWNVTEGWDLISAWGMCKAVSCKDLGECKCPVDREFFRDRGNRGCRA